MRSARPSDSRIRRIALKWLCPCRRGSGTYGTPTALKPTQAYKPFMKRLRSGSDNRASTTARSIRRKSPAPDGTVNRSAALTRP